MPPTQASGLGPGGNHRLYGSKLSFSSRHPTPGCTTASISSLCTSIARFVRLKSTQTPPRVEIKAPGRLVPPEYAVIGILLLWQTRAIELTSSVLPGSNTKDGFCSGLAGVHALLDQSKHCKWSEMTFVEDKKVSSSC